MPKAKRQAKPTPYALLLLIAAGLLVLSTGLAWASTRFTSISSWSSFFAILLLCGALFWLSWRILLNEIIPRWLLWLTLGAALLRLALGVVWFFALPAGGYDTDVQQAGYVMEDAFNRDRAAWQLAKSNEPLLVSFQGYSPTDQYGGLLFLSAAIYRYLGGAEHQPLLVLTLVAAISGLAVPFTWAFCRRVWNPKVSNLAAWGLALYPEAVLLGSSQMREAFTVFLVPVALYGLLRAREKMNFVNLALLSAPVFISIALTRAFAPTSIFLLVLVHGALDKWRWLRSPKTLVTILTLSVIAVGGFLLIIDAQDLWLMQSARWQAYVSANASGWVAREFERMPLYAQIPFLVAYGVFRPLLPSALIADGPPIWMATGIWRALGWTVLLAMLFYASYLAWRTKKWLQIPGALLLANWVAILGASYRGGGDLWDSPRYRSAFAAIQLALAAWAWVEYRKSQDPWLRRGAVGTALMIAWFLPWYLRRYADFDWPLVELYQVVGLGLASAALFVIWDWLRKD